MRGLHYLCKKLTAESYAYATVKPRHHQQLLKHYQEEGMVRTNVVKVSKLDVNQHNWNFSS